MKNLAQTRKLEKRQEECSENYDEWEEEDNNPWKLILSEVFEEMDPIRDAYIDKTVQEDEITHEEASKQVYDALMHAYTKELMKVYNKYKYIPNKHGQP